MTTQGISLKASGYPLASAHQTGCRNTGIHHVGLHAKDPSASAEFYRDLLGMQIVGGSGPEHPLGASSYSRTPLMRTSRLRCHHWRNYGRCTPKSWRRGYRSSLRSTTGCPSRSISTILMDT
jgi:hypothetical protein